MVFPLQHNKGARTGTQERRYGLPTPGLEEIVAHVNRTLRGSPGSLRFKNWLGATIARVQYDFTAEKQ